MLRYDAVKPVHGGDTAAFEIRYGARPLDVSSNVSPLGVPKGVVRAIREAAKEADAYPDPRCRALTDAIAEKERVLPEWVLCGNGASDLIRRIAQAAEPKQAIVTAPCFSEYEAALSGVNCHIVRYPLAEDFRPDEGILSLITEETGLLFLTQPCNPAGVTVPKALCERILARCEETGTRLVMDECFIDFLDVPDELSMQSYVKDSRMLVVLKAFTKIYAMAGVRLGYLLCSDRDFAEAVYEAGASWSVSHLAQAAGIAALRETDYVARVRALIGQERPRMISALLDAGTHVVKGEANFLLFHSQAPLKDALASRGILIRDCADYHGLGDGWYRIAIRTRKENDRVITAIREALASGDD